MLWIVFFHVELTVTDEYLSVFKIMGYGGVDIFMFASGVGVYFSYVRDHDPAAFICRRIKRLAPVYLPFIILWCVYKTWLGGFNYGAVIGNLFGVQGFTGLGGEFNWYITGLAVMYLLTPYFAGLVEKMTKPRQYIALVAALLLITVPFWNAYDGIIIVTRLPIFVMGMYLAKLSRDGEKKVGVIRALIIIAAAFAGVCLFLYAFRRCYDYLWPYGMYWYPFILITPGICLIISAFAELVGRFAVGRLFLWPFRKVGEFSFEIYLAHIFCFEVYQYLTTTLALFPKSDKAALAALLCVIPLCVILRLLAVACSWLAGRICGDRTESNQNHKS